MCMCVGLFEKISFFFHDQVISRTIKFDEFDLVAISCYSSVCFERCEFRTWRIFNVEIIENQFSHFLHTLRVTFFLPERYS